MNHFNRISSIPVAVGVGFSVDAIVELVKQHIQKTSNLEEGISETEVMIASFGNPVMLKERIKLVSKLWECGIKAEYTSPFEGSSLEVIINHCKSEGIPILIILKDRLYSRENALRVRLINGRQEHTINESSLVDWILQQRPNHQKRKYLLKKHGETVEVPGESTIKRNNIEPEVIIRTSSVTNTSSKKKTRFYENHRE